MAEKFPDRGWARGAFADRLYGRETILPAEPVPWTLIGNAIDLRIRSYFGELKTEGFIGQGILEHWRRYDGRAHSEVFRELRSRVYGPHRAGTRLDRNTEDRLCRYCLLLGMYEVLGRTGRAAPQLAGIDYATATADDLLERAEPVWVDDLRAQSYAFVDTQAHILGKPATLNPTFDLAATRLLGGADGDLVLGNTLLEVKSTKNPRYEPIWLYQLLGYALLDRRDEHHLDSVALYFTRQAVLIEWRLEDVLAGMGEFAMTDLPSLRDQFHARLRANN